MEDLQDGQFLSKGIFSVEEQVQQEVFTDNMGTLSQSEVKQYHRQNSSRYHYLMDGRLEKSIMQRSPCIYIQAENKYIKSCCKSKLSTAFNIILTYNTVLSLSYHYNPISMYLN